MTTFSIAEAAELSGLTAHTLRYYERDGLMLFPVERSATGHRRHRAEAPRPPARGGWASTTSTSTTSTTESGGAAGEGDFRRSAYFPRFQGDALARNLELVENVRALAETKGATPGQIALAWVLAQGQDVVPIPGTKRVAYLEENVAAADVQLSAEDLAALERAVPRDAVAGARYGDMSHIDA